MYELTNVTKKYDQGKRSVTALSNVTLTIPDGQMVAIQGPTGGGKSTLLQMLGALDRPTDGTVHLGEADLSRLGDGKLGVIRATRIGFVFQGFNLIPTLTAQENVETALAPLGLGHADRRARAAAALDSVGLGDRGGHLPDELSGGQQQRVAIARALVKEPAVLLADEPTGNLDEGTRDEIMDLLEGLWRDRGLTLIVVTHDSAVARRAQRRLQIKQGVLKEVA
ncbi:ABC transporter ATP-binding protein [Cryobacterium mannosilyticum]|uniref:ABC transporter ATP-binding protein n=1 Tax=Cryobacterium mannosilyticum TaxID=1259190 RepID=A0A4R8W4H7_9MICO|nr:ABC transporter ATP-binding protein [Cryobacterium mannosilyticum]TFB99494.1 ABC transporter ATP-binding protein [Cryobacterium mannosilyticum]